MKLYPDSSPSTNNSKSRSSVLMNNTWRLTLNVFGGGGIHFLLWLWVIGDWRREVQMEILELFTSSPSLLKFKLTIFPLVTHNKSKIRFIGDFEYTEQEKRGWWMWQFKDWPYFCGPTAILLNEWTLVSVSCPQRSHHSVWEGIIFVSFRWVGNLSRLACHKHFYLWLATSKVLHMFTCKFGHPQLCCYVFEGSWILSFGSRGEENSRNNSRRRPIPLPKQDSWVSSGNLGGISLLGALSVFCPRYL